MLLYNNSLLDLGDHIGEIGLALFVIGLAALMGTVHLVRRGLQTGDAGSPFQSIISMAFQISMGAAGLVVINSPAYVVLNHPDRICLDKDDIACAMLFGMGWLFASLLINAVAAVGLVFLIERRQWGFAAGMLFAFGAFLMTVGGFLFSAEPENFQIVMMIIVLLFAVGGFLLTQDKPKVDLGKCPNCGKLMAAETMDEQLLGIFRKTTPLSFLYNRTAVSMATYEKYSVNCKCRVCGHQWSYQTVRRQ
jgi:hypothetical protein